MGTIRSDTDSCQELRRSKRWSLLPVLTIDGYIAWEVYHGSVTSDMFNDFVRTKCNHTVQEVMDLDRYW